MITYFYKTSRLGSSFFKDQTGTPKYPMNFRKFIEANQFLFSFDFDGVLHTSMVPGTIHPLNYDKWETWKPYKAMHNQMRKDAQIADIIVVSSRHPDDEDVMWKFIRAYNLPVEQIHCTNMEPKLPILQNAGAVRHYDDNPNLKRELEGSGIEFILVKHI